MITSTTGKNLIKFYEDCKLYVYEDDAGYLTIGYGHKVVPTDNLKEGDETSEERAGNLFKLDVAYAADYVNTLPKLSLLTQNQFDAIVSLVYNVGPAPVIDTSNDLYIALNKNTFVQSEIVTGFTYTRVNGERVQGLVNRRNAELNLFFGTSNVEYIAME